MEHYIHIERHDKSTNEFFIKDEEKLENFVSQIFKKGTTASLDGFIFERPSIKRIQLFKLTPEEFEKAKNDLHFSNQGLPLSMCYGLPRILTNKKKCCFDEFLGNVLSRN